MKKIAISLILILTLLLSSIVPVYGINQNNLLSIGCSNVEPRWLFMKSFIMNLTVEQSPIHVGFFLEGPAGTTFSNGTLVLKKISGSNTGVIATWTGLSSNSWFYSFSEPVQTFLTAGQYSLTLTITATYNGMSEVLEDTKVETYT